MIKPVALAGILALSVAGLTQIAAAQSVSPPRAGDRPQPPQPTNSAGVPVEGWAIVRYSVLEDGETANVRVVDAVPPGVDTDATVDAIESWTFSPATQGGEAVEWHNGEALVIYRSAEASTGPSSEFESQYSAIQALVETEEPDLETALEMNTELLEETATQLDELGLALAQRALITLALGDVHEAYESIRLATDPRVSALSDENLYVSLQLRLQTADQLGRAQDVVATHQRIAEMLDPAQEDPLADLIRQVRERLTNEEVIQVVGRVDDDPWRLSADRRIFTIANVEGSIDEIDVECDRRRASLEYQADVEWQLPASWGDCELFVNADPGTTFSLYSFLTPAEAE